MSDKRIALITGASRGIGRAIAKKLAQDYVVFGTATSDAGADKITSYFSELGLPVTGRVLNVADNDSINALFDDLKAQDNMPDLLVNNAGITRDNLLMRMSDEQWQSVIDTNLTAIFKMTKACLRSMMKKRYGRIISIGSVVGAMGNPGQPNYCAAKAGLVGFTKSLAREVGSRNITANVVAPGFIQTDMTDALSDDQHAALVSNIPLARIGQPDDIAAAVKFLASDEAAYITGETININGGLFCA